MNEKVICRFCRFYGEPEKTKISKKKPVFELKCSHCGNVIGSRYMPKITVEKRCES